MKYNYFYRLTCVFLFLSFSVIAQNKQERKEITKNYQLSELENLRENYAETSNNQKNNVLTVASQKGWKVNYTDAKGSYYELMRISEEGKPLYYKTFNVAAAVSTRANFLHNNGGLGLNIEGQGMTAHVWDGGIARVSHQEYFGDGPESRFSVGDGSSALNFHAAHVTGTVIASGVDPQSKGMAPKATAVGYDWNNDQAEVTSAAANGMLISNHSYGFGVRDEDGNPSLPAYYFGGYINESRTWDDIAYNAPYYLMVVAAGNEGNDDSVNGDPLNGDSAFDKLTGHSTSKNNLVISNGNDALINEDGTLNFVSVSSSSSEGPTDDLRVKPDLMGNGSGLYSTYHDSNSSYNSISGTSMASPNVAGSLLLLQQYYKETYGNFMRAATLKGLALHTADDAAIPGPDAASGWGLLNTKKAAETVTKKDFQSIISEIEIVQGGTYTIVVKSDGISPLLASVSWTDLPGVANTGLVNDATPVLVHDIDIKVTNSVGDDVTTFLPWKLTSVNENMKGDNIVDPFERVDIENASGEYTITVSHKGTLQESAQKVSLIVTGVSSGIALLTTQSNKTSCENTATFDFNYVETIGGTTVFSVADLPANASVNLSASSMSADGNFTATFGNLDNVMPGLYTISLTGTNDNETTTTPIQLRVIHSSFSTAILPSYPTNGLSGVTAAKMDFSWQKNNNAETYLVEVSDSPSFAQILFEEEGYDQTFTVYAVKNETIYYWRIKPKNSCASGDYSPTYSFQTGISDCSRTYEANDFSKATMDTIEGVTAIVPMNILDNAIIDKIIVNTDVSHTWPGDLTISLKAPESLNKEIVLFTSPCTGDGIANIQNVTIDDAGADLACSNSAPAISGTVAPENNMSIPFYGEDAIGVWELVLFDGYNGDGGQINAASITICDLKANTNLPSLQLSDIIVEMNTSYTFTSADMLATSSGERDNTQEYIIVSLPTKGRLEFNGIVLAPGDTFVQKDIKEGSVKYINLQTASFGDAFKVDILNAAKGWLPDNTVTIREATLSIDSNIIEGVSFWPNPVKNILNVKISNTDTEKVFISLFDLRGRKISQVSEAPLSGTFTKEINLESIASGVYLLNIQQGNKKTIKKIIVSN